jgi:hypothetical protein
MLLVVALLALCSHRSAQLALVGLLAVVCLVNLRVPNLRADGPSWSEELDQGRATCAEQVATGARLRLPPADNSWYAELPCDYVRR